MAGNTKFMGFEPDNRVTFERWGKSTTVELPGPAIAELREAIFTKLPKRPSTQNPRSDTAYDKKTGTIQLNLTPDLAKVLEEFLRNAENPRTWNDAEDPAILGWSNELQRCLDEHYAYINTEGEPGVESTPEE